ncbi:DUF3068 domain-containing protein [Nocardioides daphniae]|uniref:DUF3068 domain-containing protein n=1 Tax=Nocardioides daphniae TaxID=402297 RepID=A0A4P7UAF6_9ACTN|nr:DUF3068 domain-containing protein [Nocardioides daphniae]QCC77063.1 DUF3068 domain-containing protein [Nocardioides daphniae]
MSGGSTKVRGKLGPILSGIGGFLLVAGILLNVYAYPKLATAPMDQDSTSTLVGPDATVFDIGSLTEINTELTTTAKTVGDVEDSEEAGDNIRVWVNSTSTKSADGVVRSRSIERVAFDGFTGEAVDCCNAWSETTMGQSEETKFEGQVFKFPFQTEKKTYKWWDGTLKRAIDAKFEREEELDGINTYVFVQTIEPEIWTQAPALPPEKLGMKGKEPIVADRTYGNIRTFWVEPETGVVLNRVEQQSATLQVDGEDKITVTDVETEFTKETVANNVKEYGDKAKQLKLIRSTLPLALGIGGLLLILVGFLLHRRAKASEY